MTVTAPSSLAVSSINSSLGAGVDGIDLAADLVAAAVTAIKNALLRLKVLVSRDQHLIPEKQRRFALLFGELYVHPLKPYISEMLEILILEHKDDHPPPASRWHADSTFLESPPLGTLLDYLIFPPVGGRQESATLLFLLFNHLTQPEFTYRHRWSLNDLVFWDNRWTQHFVVTDHFPHPRQMHRASINGEGTQ